MEFIEGNTLKSQVSKCSLKNICLNCGCHICWQWTCLHSARAFLFYIIRQVMAYTTFADSQVESELSFVSILHFQYDFLVQIWAGISDRMASRISVCVVWLQTAFVSSFFMLVGCRLLWVLLLSLIRLCNVALCSIVSQFVMLLIKLILFGLCAVTDGILSSLFSFSPWVYLVNKFMLTSLRSKLNKTFRRGF